MSVFSCRPVHVAVQYMSAESIMGTYSTTVLLPRELCCKV